MARWGTWRKRFQQTDEQILTRVRKSVDDRRRWRRWGVVFNLLFAVGWIWLVAAFGEVLAFFNRLGSNGALLYLGTVFGICLGAITIRVVERVATTFLTSFDDRRDELLLEYHDALARLSQRSPPVEAEATSSNAAGAAH